MKKDELAYSANHNYREGYEDGKYDGAQEANQRIPKLIKEIHDLVWNQGLEWGRQRAIIQITNAISESMAKDPELARVLEIIEKVDREND